MDPHIHKALVIQIVTRRLYAHLAQMLLLLFLAAGVASHCLLVWTTKDNIESHEFLAVWAAHSFLACILLIGRLQRWLLKGEIKSQKKWLSQLPTDSNRRVYIASYIEECKYLLETEFATEDEAKALANKKSN